MPAARELADDEAPPLPPPPDLPRRTDPLELLRGGLVALGSKVEANTRAQLALLAAIETQTSTTRDLAIVVLALREQLSKGTP